MDIRQNEPDETLRRISFHITLADGITPAIAEAGGQPSMMINDAAPTTAGLGVLVASNAASGDYYAQLTQAAVNITELSKIVGQYKGFTTAEAVVIPVQIIMNTPSDVYSIVAHAAYGLSALKTLIGGLVTGVWAYATRKLTSREIKAGENIASQESMVRFISNGNIPYMETVIDDIPVEIIRGDRRKLPLPLSAGWDITGRKAYFILKKVAEADNATAIVNRECTIIDAVNCEIVLTEDETAIVDIYHAEVEVRDLDETNPQTAKQFPVKIKQDVRQ